MKTQHTPDLLAENERLKQQRDELLKRAESAEAALLDIQTQVQSADENFAKKWAELQSHRDALLAACERLVLAFDVGDMMHASINGRGYSALRDARAAIAKSDVRK